MCWSRWYPKPVYSTEQLPRRLHSLRFLAADVDRAANAETQVYGRANDGEAEIVAYTAMKLPALLERALSQETPAQPGHDAEHADPYDTFDNEHQYTADPVAFLLMKAANENAIVVEYLDLAFPRETAARPRVAHSTT